jgi:formate--tetrahydrofolate ligase
MAMKLGDYAVTEAGFGADLGAEKFLDIKCRAAGLVPSAVVIVATVRALKMHGGRAKTELGNEDLDALEKGLPNLLRHVSNITEVYKLPAVVAVNRFPTDTDAEVDLVIKKCAELGVKAILSDVWAKGGEGGIELAHEVVRLCDEGENNFSFSYPDEYSIEEKIEAVVKKLMSDKNLMEKFEKNPVKVIEELLGVDLPDDLVNNIIDGVKAKLNLEKVGDALEMLGGLFGKK